MQRCVRGLFDTPVFFLLSSYSFLAYQSENEDITFESLYVANSILRFSLCFDICHLVSRPGEPFQNSDDQRKTTFKTPTYLMCGKIRVYSLSCPKRARYSSRSARPCMSDSTIACAEYASNHWGFHDHDRLHLTGVIAH